MRSPAGEGGNAARSAGRARDPAADAQGPPALIRAALGVMHASGRGRISRELFRGAPRTWDQLAAAVGTALQPCRARFAEGALEGADPRAAFVRAQVLVATLAPGPHLESHDAALSRAARSINRMRTSGEAPGCRAPARALSPRAPTTNECPFRASPSPPRRPHRSGESSGHCASTPQRDERGRSVLRRPAWETSVVRPRVRPAPFRSPPHLANRRAHPAPFPARHLRGSHERIKVRRTAADAAAPAATRFATASASARRAAPRLTRPADRGTTGAAARERDAGNWPSRTAPRSRLRAANEARAGDSDRQRPRRAGAGANSGPSRCGSRAPASLARDQSHSRFPRSDGDDFPGSSSGRSAPQAARAPRSTRAATCWRPPAVADFQPPAGIAASREPGSSREKEFATRAVRPVQSAPGGRACADVRLLCAGLPTAATGAAAAAASPFPFLARCRPT
jgi:hypothetical protein